jgi:Glu-tRNA(Gln) amidotransferase subunit E-like FAD-binding protein
MNLHILSTAPPQYDKNALRNILLSRGWNKWEVNSYDDWYERIQRYETESVFAFIHALLAKYASILFKFELNEFAKSILIKIIIETLNKHLDNRFLTEKKTSSTNRVTESEVLFSKLLKNLSETVEELPRRYSWAVGDNRPFVEVFKPIKYGKQEAYKLMESIVLFLKSPSEFESLMEQNKRLDQLSQESRTRLEKGLSNQQRKEIKRIRASLRKRL